MKYKFYVLKRDSETKIVAICDGNDPLYGEGSWDLAGGPYPSWTAAENAAVEKPHRNQMLSLRLSAAEMAFVTDQAEKAGVSVSDYIRSLIL